MKVDDKTEIAELMKCFSETEIDNPKFPKLSRRAKFLKESEGGMMVMCDVMEEYMAEERKKFLTLIGSMIKTMTVTNRAAASPGIFAGNAPQIRTGITLSAERRLQYKSTTRQSHRDCLVPLYPKMK